MVIPAGAGSPDQSQYHNFLLPVVDFSTNPTSIRWISKYIFFLALIETIHIYINLIILETH